MLALVAAATRGGFVALRPAATLAFFAAAVFLAFLHRRFHVLAVTAGLAVFRFTLVFAATVRGIFGVGRRMVAAALAVFHVSHVVMTASLGLTCGCRVRRC